MVLTLFSWEKSGSWVIWLSENGASSALITNGWGSFNRKEPKTSSIYFRIFSLSLERNEYIERQSWCTGVVFLLDEHSYNTAPNVRSKAMVSCAAKKETFALYTGLGSTKLISHMRIGTLHKLYYIFHIHSLLAAYGTWKRMFWAMNRLAAKRSCGVLDFTVIPAWLLYQ